MPPPMKRSNLSRVVMMVRKLLKARRRKSLLPTRLRKVKSPPKMHLLTVKPNPRMAENERTVVRIHQIESEHSLCIKNKIWNGNADTWLVKAFTLLKLKIV